MPPTLDQQRRPDGQTIRTLDTDHGVRVELDVSFYDDNRVLPPGSQVWVEVARNGRLSWGGPEGRPFKPLPRFAGTRGRAAGYSPLGVLMNAMRSGLRPEVEAEHDRKHAEKVAAAEDPEAAVLWMGEAKYHHIAGRDRKNERDARMLWNAMWRRILPFVDQDALRMYRSVAGDLRLYQAMVQVPAVKDLASQGRGVLELMAWLQGDEAFWRTMDEISRPGVRYRDAVSILLQNIGRGLIYQDPSPGFITWCRRASFTPRMHPYPDGHPRFSVIQNLLSLGELLDPNRIRHVQSADSWYLLHFLAGHGPQQVLSFLGDVAGSTQAIMARALPEDGYDWERKLDRVRRAYTWIQDAVNASALGDYDYPVTWEMSFPRLVRESERYHRDLARVQERRRVRRSAEHQERQKRRAETVFPEPAFTLAEEGPWRMRWLGTGQALMDESERMHHCVRTYVEACATRRSVIYTIEERESGKAVATAEFRTPRSLVQLYGPRNNKVTPELRDWVLEQARVHAPQGLLPVASGGAQISRAVPVPAPVHEDRLAVVGADFGPAPVRAHMEFAFEDDDLPF